MSTQPKPTLLVLAAGMGSRYGGLKQMDPMGPHQETILDYSVYDAIRAGFGRVIFVIREFFAEEFKTTIGARFEDKIEVGYVYQDLHDLPSEFTCPSDREKPWGTAHAIWSARNAISGPFAMINADDFYGQDSYQQIIKHFTENPPHTSQIDHYCMVGYKLSNTLSDHGDVNRGLCVTEKGLLKEVEEHEKIKINPIGLCKGYNLTGKRVEINLSRISSMNFWGFSANIFNHIEEQFIAFLSKHLQTPKSEYFIPTVVDALIKNGKADCAVIKTSSSWIGVTYPEDKKAVMKHLNTLIEKGVYPVNLWA